MGEQTIEFATDNTKNVTVVMGENASGKTTLAQAFTWCLYGVTDFEDPFMLNHRVAEKLLPENRDKVRVQLDLIHGGIDYSIIREQPYQMNAIGEIKPQNTSFNIRYKREDGQQKYVDQNEVADRMKQILPRELSKYFFFDGERIDKMSKEIMKGRSREFADAVQGLLGLNALQAALDHLKPTSKNSVIGSYNQSFDAKSDERIGKYSEEIAKAQERLNQINERLEEIEKEKELAAEKSEQYREKLRSLEETEEIQKKIDTFDESVKISQKNQDKAIGSLLNEFNLNFKYYFAQPLISKALLNLEKAEKIDKGIPDMKARTIDFLIKRGTCICGNKIEFGNDEYEKLLKVRDYLPPQSIGMQIRQFEQDSHQRISKASDLFDRFRSQFTNIQGYGKQIEDTKKQIEVFEATIEGKERAGSIVQELRDCEQKIRDLDDERDRLNVEKGSQEQTRDRKEKERKELTLLDEQNKKIEIYKAYAQYVYDDIAKSYLKKEAETRQMLEKNINEIFKNIYEGGLSLSIDEKYNIQVSLDEGSYRTDVETSTAQNISIILSFIAGVIKMASEDNEDKIMESEPYPLVMDAPLSAFDKRRIKTLCEVLPRIAEQVIIFIKDTDGELAEKNMGEKVGKRYLFHKKNEIETYLENR